MRIISGIYKGRILKDPKGHRTHPMSERIRGGLFNTLGNIDGLYVLDAYAGSGAIALEALSRGAAVAVAVEVDPSSFATLKANRLILPDNTFMPIHRANIVTWLTTTQQQFDIVICDPPYDSVQTTQLDKIVDALRVHGIMAVSLPKGMTYQHHSLTLVRQSSYGDALLAFYKKNDE